MLQTIIDKIRNSILAKEVREAIADGLEQAYTDAADSGNTAVEVAQARGAYGTLGARLDAENAQVEQLKADTGTLAAQAAQLALDIKVMENVPGTIPEGQIVIIARR